MNIITKTQAFFFNCASEKIGHPQSVQNGIVPSIHDAITYATENDFTFFSTYDVRTISVNNKPFAEKTLFSEDDFNGRNFVGVKEIISTDKWLELQQEKLKTLKTEKHSLRFNVFSSRRKDLAWLIKHRPAWLHHMKNISADSKWIQARHINDWVELQKQDKAFDLKGRQLWPAPTAV